MRSSSLPDRILSILLHDNGALLDYLGEHEQGQQGQALAHLAEGLLLIGHQDLEGWHIVAAAALKAVPHMSSEVVKSIASSFRCYGTKCQDKQLMKAAEDLEAFKLRETL